MIRTQIQLQDSVYDKLRDTAVRQRRSMAACVRDAILAIIRQAEASTDDLSDIAGKFKPLRGDEVKGHDRAWAEAAVRERSGQ